MPTAERAEVDAEIAVLQARRGDLASLIGEDLLAAASAGAQLEGIATRLVVLDTSANDTPFSEQDLIDPAAAWADWTMPQRRSAIRLLFNAVALRHTDGRNGPRADPPRIQVGLGEIHL